MLCPIRKDAECVKDRCAWWIKDGHNSGDCAITDNALSMEYIACLRDVLERIAKTDDSKETNFEMGETAEED